MGHLIPAVKLNALYKFEIRDANGNVREKADPYAFGAELRPTTASIVRGLPDEVEEPAFRARANAIDAPISIYEVHLGSWKRNPENNFWLTYEELAKELVAYVKDMGFTHIEFLPVSEYPFDGSWGYQATGLYAPTSRFGSPEELRALIKAAHDEGISVILDWVVGHFPTDDHGLAKFDGTALYEHADPREGYHQDWNTLIYNFGRNEVKNFLQGNALYWIERFGFDGIRVDAVASMIYRNYSRKDGEWIPNQYGGHENLEAIAFLRDTNTMLKEEVPAATEIAEESTSFANVTRQEGLNFSFKWNMGWMNDTLRYMMEDPINRKYHHNKNDLRHDVPVQRKLCAAAFSRRSRTWQTLVARTDARRLLATICQLARLLRLYVRLPRQKTLVYGQRVCTRPRVELQRRTGLVPAGARGRLAQRRTRLRTRVEPCL